MEEKSYTSDVEMLNQKKELSGLPFVLLITSITALGGFLFGFDNGSIAGAIGFLQDHFNLSPLATGWVTSSLMVGCFAGTILAGKMGDLFGRKKVLLLCGLLFALSSAGMAFAQTVSVLVISRIFLGIAIGMEITLAPLYIAEISPAKIRGRLVSFNQLLNCVGNLAIFSVSAFIANTHTQDWNNEYAWRWIFGVGIIPSIIFFSLLFLIPESPRWLLQKKKHTQALKVLEKINGRNAAKNIIDEMQQTIEKDKGRYSDLLKPSLRKGLIIAITVAFAQQITGINAVIYYAPEIFKSAGAGSNAAMLSTVMIGLVLVIFTLLSIWLIDKIGRKMLLLIGSSIMTVCLIGTGFSFGMEEINGVFVLVFLLVYVAAFAISFGTVAYVLISEIFPTHIRGLAASVATFFLYVGQFLVAQFFPVLVSSVGSSVTFYVFALFSVLSLIFTVFVVPETKGKSLEEIESSYNSAAH